jgi:hypothetical protein
MSEEERLNILREILTNQVNQLEETKGGYYYRFDRKTMERIADVLTPENAIIAKLQEPPTEDDLAFGRNAWVYCKQHMRAHQTGWCGVGVRDKVALGVMTAEDARAKCRDWGFELYYDTH